MPDYLPDSPLQPDMTVTYAQRGDVAMMMDIWLPRMAVGTVTGLRPGVLFVHGGGWQGGGRHQFHWHASQMAMRGFVAASCSYRLVPTINWPAPLDDCQQAVRFLRTHANQFHLDGARLAAVGSSAGGHLVACLGTRDTRDSHPELTDVSSRVSVVVDIHGIHDLPTCHQTKRLPETLEKLIGAGVDEKQDQWRDASPQYFVDEHTAPMLLLHDPADDVVPYDQSVTFAAALMRAHRPVRFIPTPGSKHGFAYNPQNEWTRRTWPAMVQWIEEHLVHP